MINGPVCGLEQEQVQGFCVFILYVFAVNIFCAEAVLVPRDTMVKKIHTVCSFTELSNKGHKKNITDFK